MICFSEFRIPYTDNIPTSEKRPLPTDARLHITDVPAEALKLADFITYLAPEDKRSVVQYVGKM